MNAAQSRMARAATRITVRELAQRAQVNVQTIVRLENGGALRPRTVAAMKTVLEEAGAIFVEDEAQGTVGVLLRPQSADE